MPKCLDKECVNGVRADGTRYKVCKTCMRYEQDLEESDDYVVYYENGRAIGFELIVN